MSAPQKIGAWMARGGEPIPLLRRREAVRDAAQRYIAPPLADELSRNVAAQLSDGEGSAYAVALEAVVHRIAHRDTYGWPEVSHATAMRLAWACAEGWRSA